MKNPSLNYLCIFAYLFVSTSCNLSSQQKAKNLIQKSIVAHGGMEKWGELQEMSFNKTTVLFLADGEVEGEQFQHLNFRFKPYFEGEINWVKEETKHAIIFDGIQTKYKIGENEVINPDFLAAKKRDFDAAFYVMDKPFALLNPALHLEYLGMDTLSDGQIAEKIKVIDGDPNEPNADVWYYFFDAESHLLIAYQVKTKDHVSQVYNETFDKSSGLLLPEKRSSYRLDPNGKHQYLRATYVYSEYKVKT